MFPMQTVGLARHFKFLFIICTFAPHFLTSGCANTISPSSQPKVSLKISLSDIYELQLNVSKLAREQYFDHMRNLTFLDYFNDLLSHTTDDAYIVDGHYFEGMHRLLNKSKPYYLFLQQKFGTVGQYWDTYHFDPTQLPKKNEFITKLIQAITHNNQQPISLSLKESPPFDDLLKEGKSLPSVINPGGCDVGFHIADPSHWIVNQTTGASIPVQLTNEEQAPDRDRLDKLLTNVDAWINSSSRYFLSVDSKTQYFDESGTREERSVLRSCRPYISAVISRNSEGKITRCVLKKEPTLTANERCIINVQDDGTVTTGYDQPPWSSF